MTFNFLSSISSPHEYMAIVRLQKELGSSELIFP